jgi:hypothetical protein
MIRGGPWAAVLSAFLAAGDGLEIDLPPLEGLVERPVGEGNLRGWWTGTLRGSAVEIRRHAFPSEKHSLVEPEEVTEIVVRARTSRGDSPDANVRIRERHIFTGAYGWAPHASVVLATVEGGGGRPEDLLVLGGLLEDEGYAFEVSARPPLEEAGREEIFAFFREGIRSSAPPRDPRWTEEEIRERIDRDVPDPKVRADFRPPIRTEHYLVLTNASAGATFAKKMEEAYARVRATYPFEERSGRRLMPVFLFRTKEQYVDYYVNVAKRSREEAGRSKGHAWRDYYATYYEAPADPVHVHEATHQIFKNRLHLNGGGSWFQEGLAEYVSSSPNERKAFAKAAARGDGHIPFERFVEIPSLISNPHLSARETYLQAASLIEFLHDHWSRDKFPQFLEEMGRLPRGDGKAVGAVVAEIYGTDLAGLERAWLDHWKK